MLAHRDQLAARNEATLEQHVDVGVDLAVKRQYLAQFGTAEVADGDFDLADADLQVAAKNARMCWAMLARGELFKLPA